MNKLGLSISKTDIKKADKPGSSIVAKNLCINKADIKKADKLRLNIVLKDLSIGRTDIKKAKIDSGISKVDVKVANKSGIVNVKKID